MYKANELKCTVNGKKKTYNSEKDREREAAANKTCLLQCNNNEVKSIQLCTLRVRLTDLAVVVFPDRPGDILVQEGEMFQETGQSIAGIT